MMKGHPRTGDAPITKAKVQSRVWNKGKVKGCYVLSFCLNSSLSPQKVSRLPVTSELIGTLLPRYRNVTSYGLASASRYILWNPGIA